MILANSSPEEMSSQSTKATATDGKDGSAKSSDTASADQTATRPQTRASRGTRNATNSSTPQRQNGQMYRTKTTANPNGGYHCSYCSRYFSSRSNMVVHERTHTQERPYTCGHCGRSFTQHGQMVIHIRSHTGQRPYQCPHCSKGFTSSKVLKIHIRTHTGEKPYSCEHCGKSFAAYANLVVHRRIHTKVSTVKFEGDKNSSTRVTRKTAQASGENEASHTDRESPTQAPSPTQKLPSHAGTIPPVFVIPRCSFCFAVYGTVKDLLEHRCTRLSRRPRNTDADSRPPSFSELYEYIQNLRKLAGSQEKEELEKHDEHGAVTVGTSSKEQGSQTVAPEATEGTVEETRKSPEPEEILSSDQIVSVEGPDSVLMDSSESLTEVERPDQDLQLHEVDAKSRPETNRGPTHFVELEAPKKLAKHCTKQQRLDDITSLRSKSHEDSDGQQQQTNCTDKISSPKPATTTREINTLPHDRDVGAKHIRQHENEHSSPQQLKQGDTFRSSQSQNEPMSKRNDHVLKLSTKSPFTHEAEEQVMTSQMSPPMQQTQWISPDKPARGLVRSLPDQERPRKKPHSPQQSQLQLLPHSPQQSLPQILPHSPQQSLPQILPHSPQQSLPQHTLPSPQQQQPKSPQQPLPQLPQHSPQQSLPQPLPHSPQQSPSQRSFPSPQQRLPLSPQTAPEETPEQGGPPLPHLLPQHLSQHITRARSLPQLPQKPQPKPVNPHSHRGNPAQRQRPVPSLAVERYLHRRASCYDLYLSTPNFTSQVSQSIQGQVELLRRGLTGCFAGNEERQLKVQPFRPMKPQLDKQEAQRQGGLTISPIVLRDPTGSEIPTDRHQGPPENMDINSDHMATNGARMSPQNAPYSPTNLSTTGWIPTSHPNGLPAHTTGVLRSTDGPPASRISPHHVPGPEAAAPGSTSTQASFRTSSTSAGVGSSDSPAASRGAPRCQRPSAHCVTAISASLMAARPLMMRPMKAPRPMPGLLPVGVLPQTRKLRWLIQDAVSERRAI